MHLLYKFKKMYFNLNMLLRSIISRFSSSLSSVNIFILLCGKKLPNHAPNAFRLETRLKISSRNEFFGPNWMKLPNFFAKISRVLRESGRVRKKHEKLIPTQNFGIRQFLKLAKTKNSEKMSNAGP